MHAKTKQTRHAILARIAGACLAASLVAFSGLAAAQSVEKGKDGYVKHGCWQCHGFQGQGSAITVENAVHAMLKTNAIANLVCTER